MASPTLLCEILVAQTLALDAEGKEVPRVPRGDLTLNSKKVSGDTLIGGKLRTETDLLTIEQPGEAPFQINVLHVNNWSDYVLLENARELENLAKIANRFDSKCRSMHAGAERGLPMIHCRTGTAHTGVLIAAMQLINPRSSASLEAIIRDLRMSRNASMVSEQTHLLLLIELARKYGKPVLEEKIKSEPRISRSIHV